MKITCDKLTIQPNTNALKSLYNSLMPEASLDDFLYFDIETTGFSAKNSMCYLIGCSFCQNGIYFYRQFFAEKPEEEKKIITEFLKLLSEYKYLVHFNGDGFDIPFLKERIRLLELSEVSDLKSIDLFKAAKSVSRLLKLENYKQKTIEKFLGIHREDNAGGGELIDVYKQFLTKRTLREDNNIEYSMLILHNRDDICALPALSEILLYTLIRNISFFDNIQYLINDTFDYGNSPVKELIVSAMFPICVNQSVSYGKEPFYIKFDRDTFRIRIRMYTGELKYFYKNYKDYFYLPDEDRSIHKSVAFYVDKNHRIQAKAATCYSKKSGLFLPQLSETETPHFKINYNDTQTYFEASEEFFSDKNRLLNYIFDTVNELI